MIANAKCPTLPWGKVGQVAALIGAGSLLAIVAVWSVGNAELGIDYAFYRSVALRWLADGSYYLPHQLAGPYDVALMVDVLYPPSALVLFVPFAVLPAVLWWAVPLAVTGYIIASWRPGPWAIAAMLLLLAWPRAFSAFLYGNTDMWMMAAVAGGLRWGWPALAVTMKPSLAVFALVGIRHRSWWVALLLGAVYVALTAPLWSDYITAMQNLRVAPTYSLGSIPMLLIPVAAWVTGSSTQRPSR